MTIDSSGNVGIGIVAPSARLHISENNKDNNALNIVKAWWW